MNQVQHFLANQYIRLKTKRQLKRIHRSLQFPAKASEVKHVLVIFPRDLGKLNYASQFVQKLQETFPSWKIEMFDVDKLPKSDRNWLDMPGSNIIRTLQQKNFDLVLDLNEKSDFLCGYISAMSAAPYRLHMGKSAAQFYNIHYQPISIEDASPYTPLVSYLTQLFKD